MISIRRCLAVYVAVLPFSVMLYGRVCFFPKILGELPDVLKTLDDENVKNAGQHGINFEASSIHTVIFFSASKK